MQETIKVKINDFIFDCRTDGDKENELVIFLHGWPETSYMWKKLMSSFSEKGFYCVAPNLRGYSKEACPNGKKHYSLNKLAKDVLDISKFLNKPKFHLVGHDWGAVIGRKLVHDKRKMSQYVRAFQWPYLPEIKIRKNDFALFKKLWRNSALDEIEAYLKVFRNKKQLTASLNYYRSNYKLLKKAGNDKILGEINVCQRFVFG